MKFASVFLIFLIFVTLRETTAQSEKSFWARLFDLDVDEEAFLLKRARTVLARVVLEIPQSETAARPFSYPTTTTTTTGLLVPTDELIERVQPLLRPLQSGNNIFNRANDAASTEDGSDENPSTQVRR